MSKESQSDEFVKASEQLCHVMTENAFLRERLVRVELDLLDLQEATALQARQLQSRTFRLLSGAHRVLMQAKQRAKRTVNTVLHVGRPA
jgi:hypothetical protein